MRSGGMPRIRDLGGTSARPLARIEHSGAGSGAARCANDLCTGYPPPPPGPPARPGGDRGARRDRALVFVSCPDARLDGTGPRAARAATPDRHAHHRRGRRGRPRADPRARRARRSARRRARHPRARSRSARPLPRDLHRRHLRSRPPRTPPRDVRDHRDLPPRGAPLDTLGVHSRDRPRRQRRRHDESAEARGRAGAQPRDARALRLPLVHRRLRPARPADQGERGRRPRGRAPQPDHHVRLQQALLRAPRSLLRQSLPPARRGPHPGAARLPVPPLPRSHQPRDAALGRDERLRAGDDPRRRGGARVHLLRARGHADPLHDDVRGDRGDAPTGRGAHRGADALRLQPRELQPRRRRDRVARQGAFPRRGHRVPARRAASGDRGLVAGGRGRLGGAGRLGLRGPAHPAQRLRGGPRPEDRGALRRALRSALQWPVPRPEPRKEP